MLTGSGVGSGIVYKTDGTVVTNAHVVEGARQVSVAFADGQQVSANVRAVDRVTDVAVLQADRTDLTAATLETALPEVGALAVVVGSPLGFEATVTSGIISGLHRQIPGSASTGAPLVDLIQTDAAISPGNSGGALIDGQGRVVGMSQAYIPPSAGAVALGFAIPAANVVDVADQLLASGTAQHAYVGIQPGTLSPQIAEQLAVDRTSGAVVLERRQHDDGVVLVDDATRAARHPIVGQPRPACLRDLRMDRSLVQPASPALRDRLLLASGLRTRLPSTGHLRRGLNTQPELSGKPGQAPLGLAPA